MNAKKRKPRKDSANCSIVSIPVNFNVQDPYQQKLLEYVDRWSNFSGTIKRLIMAEMVSGEVAVNRTIDRPNIFNIQPVPLRAANATEKIIELDEGYDPVSDIFNAP